MEKKLKWPKFLTVKRTIILAVLVLFIAFILIYFLGGYKANALNKDMKEFNTDGFVSYQQMIENILPTVKQENENYKNSLTQMTTVAELREEASRLRTDKTETKTQVNDFIARAKEVGYKLSEAQIGNMLKEAISDEDRAEQLLDTYEFLFENDNYKFYFNSRYTTFKIVSKTDGTEWYSNPNNDWKDPMTGKDPASKTSAQTLIFNQQSPLIVNFLTRGGDVKSYSVYEYSISDTIGTKSSYEVIDPSFQIKINKDNKSIQVYYELMKKGATYQDYPKSLTLQRIEDLIARNKEYIASEITKIEGWRDSGEIKEIQDYVTEHRDNTYIINYAFPDKLGYIGMAAYNVIYGKDTVNENNYISAIDDKFDNINDLAEIAIEMLRVEKEFNYQSSNYNSDLGAGFYIKDKTALENQFSDKEIVDSEELDENGKKLPNKEESYLTVVPYEEMNRNTINILNQLLYTKLQYTKEDLQEDLEKFEVEFTDTDIHCLVAIEYALTDGGLKATVLNNSISESQPEIYPLYRIDILPYFTAENYEYKYKEENKNVTYATTGGIVIPDGSGAYIELNNGKVQYPQYSKRVYTTDLAFGSEIKKNDTEDILLPMYGLISNRIGNESTVHKNASAIIARVVKGAGQCTLSANISKVRDSYNRAYYTTTYRESQLVKIGSGWSESEITRFTADYALTDTEIDYYLYSSSTTDYTYSDLAKLYQDILVKEGTLKKYDNSNETVLNTELLGVYDYTTNFLGIVYSGHKTLTTYKEAQTILSTLKDWGATNMNVLYRGWRDGGLVNETFKDMSFANKLGSKKEYQEFLDFINNKENNVSQLYPITSFLEINKYNDAFGKNRYSTRDISNEYTKKYPYDLAGNMYDKSKNPYYTLSPKFFDAFAEILAENFHKKNPELSSMAFEKLGSNIVGDYKKRSVYYREDSINSTISAFNIMKEDNRITSFSLNEPYEFALPYSNNITNLPYESTLFEVFDYSIPFYQLILSGYVDYSGLAINANDEIGIQKHLMNIFQTGSNVHFTFSSKDSSELIQTDYNYYYYTQYNNWETEVKEILAEIAKYNLHQYELTAHNKVNTNIDGNKINKVYEVVYTNKTNQADTFKIYLNYSDEKVTINSSIAEIPAWDYVVVKEVK